jgi:hypothetical protein
MFHAVMNKLTATRIVLSFAAAVMMYFLWSESQKEWCGQGGGFNIGRSDYPPYRASDFGGGRKGTDFYFGGSMVILFCGIWTAAGPFLKGSGDGAPVVVVAAPPVLGIVALTQLYFFTENKAAELAKTQQRSVNYGITEAAENCIWLVLALCVVALLYGLATWFAKSSKAPAPQPASTT